MGQRGRRELLLVFAFELEFEANWYDVHHVERAAGEYIEGFYNPRGIITIAISALLTSNVSSCNKEIRRSSCVHGIGSSPLRTYADALENDVFAGSG
jgi:hypothetical protein